MSDSPYSLPAADTEAEAAPGSPEIPDYWKLDVKIYPRIHHLLNLHKAFGDIHHIMLVRVAKTGRIKLAHNSSPIYRSPRFGDNELIETMAYIII